MFRDVREDFARRRGSESISNSHISSRISSCVASGVILCFVGYIITLRATLARTEKFPRARKGEGRARMDVEEVRWWFSGERNQAICRHAGVVRIDKTTAREAYPGKCVCVMWKWNAARRLANPKQQYDRDHRADPNDVAGFSLG